MSSVENDLQVLLVQGVFDGNHDAVTNALQAGASVNGSPEQPLATIAAATVVDNAGMVGFLFEQGADPDRLVTAVDLPLQGDAGAYHTILGERALNLAAGAGSVEMIRLLLKRCRADPNVTDNEGCTPLMIACICQYVCVEVVRLLLEAGADPATTVLNGTIPLHMAALDGHMDLVNMLCSTAPATLNCYNSKGETPLFKACKGGHESVVCRLLSLGAMQRNPPDKGDLDPLFVAVIRGFVGVVRVLMNEAVIGVLGGKLSSLAGALYNAVRFHQAKILLLLLAVDGEERRFNWANTSFGCKRLLHFGAEFCHPAAVSILLEAGADETVRDQEGRTARDIIFHTPSMDDEVRIDRGRECAIGRMLQRGPAYQARSWAWPSDEEADAGGNGDGCTGGGGGGGSGCGGGGGAAAAAAAAAVLSSPPAVTPPPVIGVRIMRAKESGKNKFFVRIVGRYCAKD